MSSAIHKLLSELMATRPGSKAAEALRRDAEEVLMKILLKDGLRGVERAVGRVRLGGGALEEVSESPTSSVRSWRKSVDGQELEVSVMVTGDFRTSSVEYRRSPSRRLSKRERELAAIHENFYARYDKFAARAYRKSGDTSLSTADRRLLLVAELEADVNNGGFSQYLHNKGRRRARSAVVALRIVGAVKTQSMLEAALDPDVSEKRLAQLDDRFYSSTEDLAALVMAHLEPAGTRGKS